MLSFVDLLHTMSFRGMGGFPSPLGNRPPDSALGIGPFHGKPGLAVVSAHPGPAFPADLGLGELDRIDSDPAESAIFVWRIFPVCYVEGVGLTPLKSSAIRHMHHTSDLAALLHRKRDMLDPTVYQLVTAAILVTGAAELTFTLYVSVFGLSVLIGHFLKVISFFLIYLALVREGLTHPYAVLFRSLSDSEERFRQFFESAPDAILLETLDDQILDANPPHPGCWGIAGRNSSHDRSRPSGA